MSSLEELTQALATRIRARRLALNLSQQEAARKLRVAERTFQAWEAGENFPRPMHRRRLDKFLGERDAA